MDQLFNKVWYSWYVVFILSFAQMLAYIDRSLINLLVDPIRVDLKISDIEMSFLQGIAFGIFYAVMGLPIARLADRKSRRAIIAIGVATWSLMTFSCGLARNFGQLFLARVGVGVGEAALIPAAVSLLADYFPKDKLARANAALMLGGAIGGGIALLLGGKLIGLVMSGEWALDFLPPGLHAWQKIFVIVGLPGVLLGIFIFLTVAEPDRKKNPDGNLSVATIAEVLNFVTTHRKTFITLLLAFPFMSAAFGGWVAWLPTFFIRQYGMTPQEGAYWFGTAILTFALAGTIIAGIVNDRLFSRGYVDAGLRTAVVCSIGMALCGFLLPLIPGKIGSFLISGIFLFFCSFIIIVPPLCVQLIAPATMRAQLTAGIFLVVAIIGSLGPTLVAVFTDMVFRNDAAIAYSLSYTAILLCLPASAVLYFGIASFRDSFNAALAQTQTD